MAEKKPGSAYRAYITYCAERRPGRAKPPPGFLLSLALRCALNGQTHIRRDQIGQHLIHLHRLLRLGVTGIADVFLITQSQHQRTEHRFIEELRRVNAVQNDELHINPAHSRTLQLLAAGARETLQRYAITFWLLSANPAINRSSLEKESRTVAQRLSVLHGINAPEFFDKAVFSTLVLTLRDEGYISDTGDAEPEETLKVYRMLADLITSDVRLTIESVTQDDA